MFKSDEQRRAAFCNMNRMSLYLDDKSGRVRSTEYPQVDFKLFVPASRTIDETLVDVGVYEPYLAGVKRLDIKTKENPRGVGGSYYRDLKPGEVERRLQGIEKTKKWLKDIGKSESYIDKIEDASLSKLEKFQAKNRREERPRLTIYDVPGRDWSSHFGAGSILAHELGHHMDFEMRDVWSESFPGSEPVAEYIAETLTGYPTRKKYPSARMEFGKEQAEYELALKEQVTPSYEELSVYNGDVEE